jgi:hypothetical protein
MIYWLFILLTITIFLEGTVTTLPLVLVCLLCLTILLRNPFMFFIAFLSGFFLDVFAIRPVGQTSIFFLLVVLLIFLYQRKYEINSYPFVILASFIGSFFYLFMFGYPAPIWLAVGSSIFALLLFIIIRFAYGTPQKTNLHLNT